MTSDYNLSTPDAIKRLEDELEYMRAHSTDTELSDLTPDVAFELGYETAIFDFRRHTGPDPVELGLIEFKKEDDDA